MLNKMLRFRRIFDTSIVICVCPRNPEYPLMSLLFVSNNRYVISLQLGGQSQDVFNNWDEDKHELQYEQ